MLCKIMTCKYLAQRQMELLLYKHCISTGRTYLHGRNESLHCIVNTVKTGAKQPGDKVSIVDEIVKVQSRVAWRLPLCQFLQEAQSPVQRGFVCRVQNHWCPERY